MPVSAQTVDDGWRETARPAATPLPPGIASVLSVLSSSAVVLDAEDRVLQASDAARSFGLVEGEQLMAGELLALARQVRRDGEIREGETRSPPAGGIGGTTSFAVRVAPLGGDVGCGGLVLVLAEDQSESRRVEEVRRDFVANVSHELKTPVGALALLAETVEDAADDPDAVRRFAGRMRQEAARLTNLVQDIITLSRIQARRAGARPAAVSRWTRSIAEALDRCRMKANARGIALAAVRRPRPGRPRRRGPAGHRAPQPARERGGLQPGADPGRGHATAPRGATRVEISVERPGHRHPRARTCERIFERFYRVDPARSRATGGTGLGLAIVKHVTAAHGGPVTVWSVEGAGSTFTIRLPLRSADASSGLLTGIACAPYQPTPGGTLSDAGARRRGRGIVQRRAVLHAAQGGVRGRRLPPPARTRWRPSTAPAPTWSCST